MSAKLYIGFGVRKIDNGFIVTKDKDTEIYFKTWNDIVFHYFSTEDDLGLNSTEVQIKFEVHEIVKSGK
jgi:hypothetical protein